MLMTIELAIDRAAPGNSATGATRPCRGDEDAGDNEDNEHDVPLSFSLALPL